MECPAYSLIKLEIDGPVASIILNRPERANALSRVCLIELRTAIELATKDVGIKVIVLRAAGRAFCSGADLGESGSSNIVNRDLGEGVETLLNPLVRAIHSSPKPLVAVVNGLAVGAGCSLALACDIVVAGRSARFLQPFARYGLALDGGGSFYLPRLVGLARAKALALLSEELSAERARDMGLIWEVVDDDQLQAAGDAVVERLLAMSPLALGWIKGLLHASLCNSVDQQLDLERDRQSVAGRSADFCEAVAAFREKRKARFATNQ
jgi:2-(1,2-epoxy-1,2-dihydrophenyl)acetyl-CoA isomerase